jgi:hypothetical protein
VIFKEDQNSAKVMDAQNEEESGAFVSYMYRQYA